MLRWWFVLLSSEFYRLQARSIIDERCAAKSPSVIPDRCILKCVQLLYDNKFCSICENEEAPVDKRKLEWCSACENDQWHRNSTHYEFYRHIANFFNALEISWCNDALNLIDYKDMKELRRTKRYNPGIGGSHSSPNSYSHSTSHTSIMMGMIIFGIFLLCALGCFCRLFAKNRDPQESYEINP